ncbi:50S ribosomal protein L31 [Candidatus Nomurabacteria bacterium]|uniref:Large ribosomal subunit protein bL31 n=1 Tax=candidate division WWE3 bacterium TaxID=2053526 RepID=A0A955IVY4_UNCKA|nr:50S ribosomal protein L31 [candidate division WWE3 bacterium]MCB9823682.1 50S ribosomal protein L31 [Candidatus Nomurabacteria bacterium]MCB9827240.1 50S ribosomal protein L31 [Candidatus Nomurabacteria bacterium]MCB9827477.1 50S ribosomal protein L31 [Candidatus Nomurabacteria bacterium]HXK52507.1 50S ribosomal protein L31 [bacterium]
MKKDIHPQVNKNIKITCACGTVFTTSSTLDDFKVDICSNCHPYYTGKQKFVDTEGRIDKFQKKLDESQKKKAAAKNKKSKEKEKVTDEPKTLKELMEEASKKS